MRNASKRALDGGGSEMCCLETGGILSMAFGKVSDDESHGSPYDVADGTLRYFVGCLGTESRDVGRRKGRGDVSGILALPF